jgi:hypothetical protein
MKVETNVKSGALLQDAANTASQAATEVGGFFTKAGAQAQSLTSAVTTKASNVWNCLAS